MFDYSEQIKDFRNQKVRLPENLRDKLFAHRQANRDRIIARLPNIIDGISVSDNDFCPQGSVAIQTIIQTRFTDDEYDIDDGLILSEKDISGLSHIDIKEKLKDALEDERFKKQPEVHHNCVRVFYANTDEEKHHVDFPVYRKREDDDGNIIQELAGAEGWTPSDPTQVNAWFIDEVANRNKRIDGLGTQFRQLVQLLKRFCRSREEWDMPNGMKLTMLVAEMQPEGYNRLDEAFYHLMINIRQRLTYNKKILNLAHPNMPELTKSDNDTNVQNLYDELGNAIDQCGILLVTDNIDEVREAWDYVFMSDGFFEKLDDSSTQKLSSAQGTFSEKHTSASIISRTIYSIINFNVPHRERPSWQMEIQGSVVIHATYSKNGYKTRNFKNNPEPLPKDGSLRFQASTNISRPYKVYWQVVNTGDEATRDNGLRGDLFEGIIERGGSTRKESTRYRGSHWIECFIVKNRTCVARSGEFIVNIE